MKPEKRLEKARAHLRNAAHDEETSDLQAEAIFGVTDVITALLDSMRVQRDGKLMTDGGQRTIDTSELSEEEIEAVLQTPAFQKSLKYRRLAQGIEVLEEDDAIYRQLVATITEQHGQVSTRSSIEEVLELFVEEVKTYTEGMDVRPDDGDLDDPLQAVITQEGDDE